MTRKISRRQFLGEASCASVGSASLFSTLLNMRMTNTAAAYQANNSTDSDDYKALVCLFLAGGNDSFNMLVPMDNDKHAEYQQIRSDLALAQDSLLPLNGTTENGRSYGVHPAMPEVQQLYNSGDLALVANVGTLVEHTTKEGIESGVAKLPVGLYSHIDQIAHWQTSVPDKRSSIGWGGRTADLLHSLNDNQNISMNISISGSNIFQAGNSMVEYAIEPRGNGSIGINGFDQPIDAWDLIKKSAIESLLDVEYQNLFEQTLANTKRGALDNHFQFSNAIGAVSPFQTVFSENQISKSFEMIAKTIAARQTLGFKRQTFFILFGGWDHHDEVLNNQMAMLSVVSKAMSEFNTVMKELGVHDKVTTFTASDFARTLTSNGAGSDHAWGGNHMVMGGSVNGTKIYGQYPDLFVGNALDTGRGALIPTISCDEYFAEMAAWFGVSSSDLSAVLPNIGRFYDTSSEKPPIGFMGDAVPATSLPFQQYLPVIKEDSLLERVQKPKVATPFLTGVSAAAAGMLALRTRQTDEDSD
ncbi:MAG: DUF1501 domain-containing protein [Chloroflexota bacterium]